MPDPAAAASPPPPGLLSPPPLEDPMSPRLPGFFATPFLTSSRSSDRCGRPMVALLVSRVVADVASCPIRSDGTLASA